MLACGAVALLSTEQILDTSAAVQYSEETFSKIINNGIMAHSLF